MRMVCAIAALALLGSCSPPMYEIVARRDGSAAIFDARPHGKWPFKKDDNNVRAAFVMVRDAEHIVWRIEVSNGPACGEEAQRIFPLVYGRVPRCYAATAPAQALRPDTHYTVQATGGDFGYGFFRYGGTIANLDRDDAENAIGDWKPIGDEAPEIVVGSNAVSANTVIERDRRNESFIH
jgi:hypothetical protein